jgi:enterochelin esterase family protein
MIDGAARVAGSVHIENYNYTADSETQKDVPVGKLLKFEWRQSRLFPETVREVTVYIPEQYKPGAEACLMVWQDGSRHVDPKGPMRASVVFDNLIHQKQMPVTIGVFVDPGRKLKQKAGEKAANRSFEYDNLGSLYGTFLLEEILPEVQKRFGVKFRPEPESRAIAGGSSGGICAFTAAWERPDQFHKVLSWVGTFVDIHGGNAYPYLLRVTERKPIRVYLLDGSNDLDNKYGNWPLANRMMEASLKYMNYDFRMDWTQCFHGSKAMATVLPEALKWLWRDVK